MDNLVFVHGFLGGSSLWAEQAELFSARFRVVAPDLPGFGNNCTAPAPDRIEGFAEHVLRDLDERGVDSFHLVGHSMGGMVAQQMADQAPARLRSLVLYGTGPVGLLPGRFESIAESRRRAEEEGPEATTARIAASWFVAGAAAAGYRICAELGRRSSLQAIFAGLSAMEAWDGRGALSAISAPTLVLWGDRDKTYAWSQPEALWRGIAGASLAVVPGCAHMVHLEKPELFNALLKDFLRPA